jgi:hypothetical protein
MKPILFFALLIGTSAKAILPAKYFVEIQRNHNAREPMASTLTKTSSPAQKTPDYRYICGPPISALSVRDKQMCKHAAAQKCKETCPEEYEELRREAEDGRREIENEKEEIEEEMIELEQQSRQSQLSSKRDIAQQQPGKGQACYASYGDCPKGTRCEWPRNCRIPPYIRFAGECKADIPRPTDVQGCGTWGSKPCPEGSRCMWYPETPTHLISDQRGYCSTEPAPTIQGFCPVTNQQARQATVQ